MDALDRQLFLWCNADGDAHAWLVGAMHFLAVHAHWMVLALVAGYALIRWRPPLRPLAIAVLAVGLGSLACELITWAWDRPRPFEHGMGYMHLLHAPSPSFPSSHATVYSALAFSFLLVAGHRLFGNLLLVVAALIGAARVVVGVHYPMDIVGGLLLGGLAAAAAMLLIAMAGRRHGPPA